MKGMLEFKGIPMALSLKDVDEKTGTVIAYAASFDTKDDGNDIIRRGAFKKTIAEWGPSGRNRIVHLYQHNRDLVLAKPTELVEDEFGLKFTSTISKTTWGRDVLTLYADHVINEHSIGYDTITEKRDPDTRIRELLELRLWDVSSVTWGMNQWTPTVGLKGMENMKKYLDEFENINRVLRKNLSDDVAHDLEYRLRQLKAAFLEIHESHETGPASNPPGGTTVPVPDLDEIAKAIREQTIRMNKILKG